MGWDAASPRNIMPTAGNQEIQPHSHDSRESATLPFRTLKGFQKSISCLKFSPNHLFLTVTSGNLIYLFEDFNFKKSFEGHKEGVNSIEFNGKSDRFVTASDDKTIRVSRLCYITLFQVRSELGVPDLGVPDLFFYIKP